MQPAAALYGMTEINCGKCGIVFHVPEPWRAEKQRTGSSWYCPNGHCRVYRESDTEVANRRLAEEKKRHADTLSRLNEAQEEKRKADLKLGRLLKRTAHGICPHCNRTFKQLAQHMKTKHACKG